MQWFMVISAQQRKVTHLLYLSKNHKCNHTHYHFHQRGISWVSTEIRKILWICWYKTYFQKKHVKSTKLENKFSVLHFRYYGDSLFPLASRRTLPLRPRLRQTLLSLAYRAKAEFCGPENVFFKTAWTNLRKASLDSEIICSHLRPASYPSSTVTSLKHKNENRKLHSPGARSRDASSWLAGNTH